MDKFGIFKLINSFFNFCEQNKSQKNENNRQENNGLNGILSALMPKESPAQQQKESKEQPPKNFAPLQSSMLSTMNSHDQFIKRVKEKNPTK